MNIFKPKKHIAELNSVKNSLTTFTVNEIIDKFKECRLPANRTFFNAFVKWGTIKKVDKNLYSFSSPCPINYEQLDIIYNSYRSKRNQWK